MNFYEFQQILEQNEDPTNMWWAHGTIGNKEVKVGPHESRQQAVDEMFKKYPKAIKVHTGHGKAGAWGDLRWHK